MESLSLSPSAAYHWQEMNRHRHRRPTIGLVNGDMRMEQCFPILHSYSCARAVTFQHHSICLMLGLPVPVRVPVEAHGTGKARLVLGTGRAVMRLHSTPLLELVTRLLLLLRPCC